jgi:hypothetical protein
VVIAVAAGTATLTATSGSVVGTVTVTVTDMSVASVVVLPGLTSVSIGSITTLTAYPLDAAGNVLAGKTVSWVTSRSDVANGTANGAVASLNAFDLGETVVRATVDGITGSARLWVTGPLTCATVARGELASGSTFLGSMLNQFNGLSILNSFGSYGDPFSALSIANSFGQYGNSFGSYSAYNSIAPSPPELFKNGISVAYVSKNTLKAPRIDPDALRACTGWP